MKFNKEEFIFDLKLANRKAQLAAEDIIDNGSINMDYAFIRIPYIRETKVVAAITAAGLSCSGRTDLFGSGYMIRPTVVGSASKNTVTVESFVDELQKLGYDVTTIYTVDWSEAYPFDLKDERQKYYLSSNVQINNL